MDMGWRCGIEMPSNRSRVGVPEEGETEKAGGTEEAGESRAEEVTKKI